MKKDNKSESYFAQNVRRQNVLKNLVLNFFLAVASHPRLALEVFIRKNFGERYFTLASAITVAVILVWLPKGIESFFPVAIYDRGHEPSFWGQYATWYLFVAAFIGASYFRWMEIRRNPSVFDFGKYSLYSGDINPIFSKIYIFGKPVDVRLITTFLEPVAFFVLGYILNKFGQKVGTLLMTCSIFYSLGYMAAFKVGDDFVMDKIDETIMNEELENAFVNDLPGEETRGVRFYTEKPKSKKLRTKVSESFIAKEETTYAN